MTDRMARLDRLLSLVHALVDRSEGMTLDDMAAHINVNRRTAERMRDIIMMHFDLEPIVEGRTKRWRIAGKLGRMFTRPNAEELAALQAEVVGYRAADQHARADILANLLNKIRGALDGPTRARTAPDFEALAQIQRIFIPAGPGIPVAPDILAAAQNAIMAGVMLEFDYQAEGKAVAEWRRVVPYGLVHGALSYLVGKQPDNDMPPAFYRLDRMRNAKVSDMLGAIPSDFELDKWMAKSFGIWREDEYDVVLRVKPSAVKRAQEWRFHPHQQMEQDGAELVIHFQAGGLRELAEHLFTWGGEIVIEEPLALRDIMIERLEAARVSVSR
ncbi:WYL domain-containing protein [Sphingopyxis granuli]|uniref:helix-turn-helix transcriptional regulator n=1 Tax=Sphingopyxis granuli TaxID=267128 RepID=UPI001F531AFF|nr:WYL domain-containing protein [Sphingopyxis granuli]UNK79497.1 WYL domain-containing protein [Sphingopyxis granuli]